MKLGRSASARAEVPRQGQVAVERIARRLRGGREVPVRLRDADPVNIVQVRAQRDHDRPSALRRDVDGTDEVVGNIEAEVAERSDTTTRIAPRRPLSSRAPSASSI